VKRRGRAAAPHEVALRLAALLPEPNALIGALAVGAHGHPRATDDVDFVCPAEPKEIQSRLKAGGLESSVRRGDVLEGALRSCVYGTASGIRFDVLFPPVPIDWESTVLLPLNRRSRLRVVSLYDLIRLKLRAGGPQDVVDIVHLLRRHPEQTPLALSTAEAYGLRDRLSTWLADPRIRAPRPTTPFRKRKRPRSSRS
jgi:hypothetical protein